MIGMGHNVNGTLVSLLMGGDPKLKAKTVYENGTYRAADEPVGQGEAKYDGYSQFTAALPLKTKSITANGTYAAADEAPDQGGHDYVGFSVVNVNVVDPYMRELQEELYFEEHGYPYDPESGDELPSPEDVIIVPYTLVPDTPPSTGTWAYKITIVFDDFYKTEENGFSVLTGTDYQSIMTDFTTTTGCDIRTESGYAEFGDNVRAGALHGKTTWGSGYAAIAVYAVEIRAKYKADENSSFVDRYNFSFKYSNTFTDGDYGGSIWDKLVSPVLDGLLYYLYDTNQGTRILIGLEP